MDIISCCCCCCSNVVAVVVVMMIVSWIVLRNNTFEIRLVFGYWTLDKVLLLDCCWCCSCCYYCCWYVSAYRLVINRHTFCSAYIGQQWAKRLFNSWRSETSSRFRAWEVVLVFVYLRESADRSFSEWLGRSRRFWLSRLRPTTSDTGCFCCCCCCRRCQCCSCCSVFSCTHSCHSCCWSNFCCCRCYRWWYALCFIDVTHIYRWVR